MSADAPSSLLDHLALVLGEQQLGGAMPPDLTGVLEAMVAVVAAPTSRASAELVDIAIALGEQRRLAGVAVERVMDDYAVLRQVLWRVLHDLPSGTDLQVDALTRFDARTTLALRASLLGHSRPQLERTGRWTQVRRELDEEAGRMSPADRGSP